jgi:hypothetical protein
MMTGQHPMTRKDWVFVALVVGVVALPAVVAFALEFL